MKYVELFAGVGGLSRGLENAGMECSLHVEIADFPRRVLQHRWPHVPLLRDVVAISGGRRMRRWMHEHFGHVDLLAGGSPCQDLSVAGKRAGLVSGVRSSLFFRQVSLWNVLGSRYFLWENVYGALSSNAGADFALVLSAIVGGTVTAPADGWRSAGVVSGPTSVAAWRCLDAQHFGVPQRRLRVFVFAARAGGVDPAAVLLESEGVRRDPAPRRKPRQGPPARARGSARVPSGDGLGLFGGDDGGDGGARVGGGDTGDGVAEAIAFHPKQDPSSDTISLALGTTSGGMGVVSFSAKDSGHDAAFELAPTLRAGMHKDSHANGGISPAVIASDTTQITHPENRSNPQPGDPSPTLAAKGAPPLLVSAFDQHSHEDDILVARMVAFGEYAVDGTASTIKARDGRDATDLIVGPLEARHAGGFQSAQSAAAGHLLPAFGIPRRLMPIECERLMSWPDRHTDVPDAKGKPALDSPRYRACGNGVVSNVAEWIGRRLMMLEAQ